jgi:VIT1/CCC1 family predicted Fe2+/Mn2+ transporter
MESSSDVLSVILEWSFLPLGCVIILVTLIGSGLWEVKWKRTVWLVGLGLLAAVFILGVGRHEWGEVLFNGQLL